MSVYTYTIEKYGPASWHTMVVGRPTGGGGGRYAHVLVPGGGWGLRDAARELTEEFNRPTGAEDNSSRNTVMNGAWDNSASSYYRGATVFCLNVASESQNTAGYAVLSDSPLLATGRPASLDPVGYGYESGTTYGINDLVMGGGNTWYISLQDSNNGNPLPANDVESTAYWMQYPSCPSGNNRMPGGEGSPGARAQGARDVQRAIAYIRRNAAYYEIDTEKVLLEGASAGAQAAGMAAYTDPLPFGHSTHMSAANDHVASQDSRPNGLILQIAACRQDEFAGVSKTSQGLFLSFMNSLYGKPGLLNQANWAALPQDTKKSLDPYWAAMTSGQYVPTFFIYVDQSDGGLSDIWTRSEMANGVDQSDYSNWASAQNYEAGDLVTNSSKYYKCIQAHNSSSVAAPTATSDTAYWAYTNIHKAGNGLLGPEIHHSWNGRTYITDFTKSPSAGGLGIPSTDIRLMLKDGTLAYGDPNTLRVYNGAPTSKQYGLTVADKEINMQSEIDVTGLGKPAKDKAMCDNIMSFFTTSGLLTKYVS